jgi:hypothetical protein
MYIRLCFLAMVVTLLCMLALRAICSTVKTMAT